MDEQQKPVSRLDNELPAYSDTVVCLARTYDRVALAARAVNWHLSESRLDADGDDDLGDWAGERMTFLEHQLPALASSLHALVRDESKQWFSVDTDQFGNMIMPQVIVDALGPHMLEAFYYKDLETGRSAALLHCENNWVILFDGDGFLLPRSLPKSMIEVWWRRWFGDARNGQLYELCLIENAEYGWDCYGHER